MNPPAREKDRRKVNVPVAVERRRQGGRDRRRCPECQGFLEQAIRTLVDGTVTASTCPACGWSKSSRQTSADILLLKMVWDLTLEPHEGGLAVVLPPELAAALKSEAGQEWTIAPLTSPLGNLPMKWALSVKRSKT